MSTKKKGLGALAVKGLAAAAGYIALNGGAMWLRYHKVMEKMKCHPEEKKQMHSTLFGKLTVYYGQDTQYGYFTCLNGAMTIILKEQLVNSDIDLDLLSAFGKVTLILPPGAKIEYSGCGCLEIISDCRAEEIGEKSYTVRLHRRNFASKLVIKGQA